METSSRFSIALAVGIAALTICGILYLGELSWRSGYSAGDAIGGVAKQLNQLADALPAAPPHQPTQAPRDQSKEDDIQKLKRIYIAIPPAMRRDSIELLSRGLSDTEVTNTLSAVMSGSHDAPFRMFLHYWHSSGESEVAYLWLERAVQSKDPLATYTFGVLLIGKPAQRERGIDLLRQAAALGFDEAARVLESVNQPSHGTAPRQGGK